MKPSVSYGSLLCLSWMIEAQALRARPGSAQVWRLSAGGCWPRCPKGSSHRGSSGSTQHKGCLLEGTVVGDQGTRWVGGSHGSGAHRYFVADTGFAHPQDKASHCPVPTVKCNLSLGRRKRREILGHRYQLRSLSPWLTGLLLQAESSPFDSAKTPSSRRWVILQSHLTPENADRPCHHERLTVFLVLLTS